MEDQNIIDMYWSRNESAIAESERKYGRFCQSIAFNILKNREDSLECTQDTWHQAWNSIPPERPCVLRAFFGRITRNLAITKYRKEHAKKRFSGMTSMLDELAECIPAHNNVENTIESAELSRTISDWLMSLSLNDRTLFVLRYWNGTDIKTLAKKYGCSYEALSQRMYRLRASLKAHLESEGISI